MTERLTHPKSALTRHRYWALFRRGKYLVNPAGERFSIKGIAYQESVATEVAEGTTYPEPTSFVDPLALSDACRRDIPNLQNLGVNVARVFSVNASLNHDDCMRQFSQANIYIILDMALPGNSSINRADPVSASFFAPQW